jgi:hypothetical protein
MSFKFQGSGFKGSRFNPAAGPKNGQIDQKRNSEKANIEFRIMNVEGMIINALISK